MSFINHDPENIRYAPGYFLASADCVRETCNVAANHSQVATAPNGGAYVPAGAYITGKGLLYEDVDVSSGAMPGSVVTKGIVYEDRLPASYNSTVKNAIPGITFITAAPTTTRPDFGPGELDEIAVQSSAGTASGDTALTLSGYTPGTGESYVYKVGTTAPTIVYGEKPDYSWTAWDGTSDITAATGKKITVASIDAFGKAVAAGSATVTAKT